MNERRSLRSMLFAVAGALGLTVTGVVTPGLTPTPVPAAAAVETEVTLPAPDGLSELTAAASCWEILRNDPGSRSGVYWLTTPAMGSAEQFYCDQERAGGGWVLVGRGREGWSTANVGSGTPAEVRAAVTGPSAFTPKQLSSNVIEQLLNNGSVAALSDGIRLVRATNVGGTQWHDMKFTLASPRETWTWQFNNEQRLAKYSIGSQTYTASWGDRTSNFGRNNNFDRVRTITGSYEGWHMGFGFGSNIRGQNNATSYLWSKDTSTGYARPFTQVFLRPQLLTNEINSPIPAEGTPAVVGTAVVDPFALPQPWGVAGLGAGPSSLEGSNEVSAFTESGSSVFVGGNFTSVQRSAGGSGAQSQAYLASFDRATGEWNAAFRPTFNNQVKALATLPDGRVAVGGYFTEVNGTPHSGLVVLNAATGQIDTAFTGRLINYIGGSAPIVRTLDVQDSWLYVGGSFSHSTGGAQSNEVYTRAAARFSVTDGTPDGAWNPEFNGTVMSVDASEQGDRVYFAGFFSQSKGRTAEKGAALAADSEALIPWQVIFSNRIGGRSGYQQAVKEVGDRVWLGGSEHSLFSYARDGMQPLSSTIGNNGGDFQAIASDGTAVYAGCHCFETQYEGASTWPDVGTNWTEANSIYGTGAWSAATGRAITEFNGIFNTRNGAGAWALFVDSAGTLWQGGDYTASTRPGFVKQWSGGFVRHEQMDSEAPSTPKNLKVVAHSAGVTLSWEAASDNQAVAAYEVLRHDRVVARVSETTVTLPAAPTGTNYAVRATDARGNASASTVPLQAQTGAEPSETQTLIAEGSTWKYRFSGDAIASDWAAPGFDDGAWLTGQAPLGWGQALLGTSLTAGSPRPLVSHYRATFDLAADSGIESLELVTRADDGIVIYVNGVEVRRVNIDDGPVGLNTYANAAVSASTALANPVAIEVPRELLVAGANTIAAEVHSNYRSTPSHSFELSAVGTFGEAPPLPEPEEPVLAQELIAEGAEWAYLFSTTAPDVNWQERAYDAASWAVGAAPLGWGHVGLGTTLDAASPKPVVSLYRHEFEIAAGTPLGDVVITTRADDGLVLAVNGVEVTRVNIDPGPVHFGAYPTYANAAVSASAALSQPVLLTIPASAFVAGTNVITASVHSNYRSTPSHSFELSAVATLDGDPMLETIARDLATDSEENVGPQQAPPMGPVPRGAEKGQALPGSEPDPEPQPEPEPVDDIEEGSTP